MPSPWGQWYVDFNKSGQSLEAALLPNKIPMCGLNLCSRINPWPHPEQVNYLKQWSSLWAATTIFSSNAPTRGLSNSNRNYVGLLMAWRGTDQWLLLTEAFSCWQTELARGLCQVLDFQVLERCVFCCWMQRSVRINYVKLVDSVA